MTDPDDVVVYVCPSPDMTSELKDALVELARAAVRSEETRRSRLSPEDLAAEDRRRTEGRARLERIRRRARRDEGPS